MKIVTYLSENIIRTGIVKGEHIARIDDWIEAQPINDEALSRAHQSGSPPASSGIMKLLQGGSSMMQRLAQHAAKLASAEDHLDNVRLFAPVPRPGKILGVGRNYADHAKETGVDPFEKPRIFAKLSSTVCGPGAIVRRHADVSKMDFEGELAVVIGKVAWQVPQEEALQYVAGYTILDDVSARELQFDISPPQTTFAKSKDGFTPMGPWLVTVDEIPDPQQLELTTWVNDIQMQHSTTDLMLFPVAHLIAYLSRTLTLEPGDVIATGTPAGIGAFRKPPQYLQPGDRVRIQISRIGTLEHGIG